MRGRLLILGITLAIGVAAVLGLLAGVFRLNADRVAAPAPQISPQPAPNPQAPAASSGTPPPVAEPAVPLDLPTPPAGLDRALTADYRRALEDQGIAIRALTIIDTRATGGIRRAEVVYRTATDGSLSALRSEIVRILGPGVNPKLALDQIVVRPIRPTGSAITVVTVTVADADRWLKAQMSDTEFYGRWTVQRPR